MSGAKYFGVKALNPYSDPSVQPDLQIAEADHLAIQQALRDAGVKVVSVKPPKDCQDGIFTANWALCVGDTAIMASLPRGRTEEEPYAEKYLRDLGKIIIKAPYRFSGQGDALVCDNRIFMGTGYRTDERMADFVQNALNKEVVQLQTVPLLDANGQPAVNDYTGWPDSYFYDLDLALAVLSPTLIAWCPEAFTPESQAKIHAITDLDKIEVSFAEAKDNFACNLVSTGQTAVIGANSPNLEAAILAKGLKVIKVPIHEIIKGGGFIRCISLTLDN